MIIKQLQNVLNRIKKKLIHAWFSSNSIGITEMHGAWDALSENAKHCSPLIGTIYWNTRYIKKLYYFGNAIQTNPRNELTFAGDKTIEVINRLFLEIQGSFNLSTNKDYVAAHLSPKIIGTIIGTLESYNHKDTHILATKLITIITNHPDYKTSILTEKKTRTTNHGTKVFSTKTQKSRLTALCTAIAESLSEQGWHDNQRYPPHTTHAILLSALYRKANNRQDLQHYFEALQATVTCNKPAQSAIFNNYTFNNATPYKTKELESIHEQKFSTIIFEKYIIGGLFHFYRQPLPKIFKYKNVQYKKTTYPNCVESIIRNLCNIALYNNKTETFNYAKYAELHPAVKEFYTYNTQSENADQTNVHQAWVDISVTQLFIIYNRCLKDGKPIYLDGKFMRVTKLFIKNNHDKILQDEPFSYLIHSVSKQKIKIYLVPENTPYCYLFNMRASLSNIIIQCNQLLGLNLFNSFEPDLFNETFNETYFPQLVEKLDWILESNHTNWNAIGWEQPVKIDLVAHNVSFSINISDSHGYMATPPVISTFPSISIESLHHNWKNLLLALVVDIDKPSTYSFSNTLSKMQFYFINDLFNDTNKLDFLKQLTDKERTTLIYSINHMADRLEMTDDLIYHLEFLTLLSPEQSKHDAIQPFIEKMIEVARTEIASNDDYTKNIGQWFFIELVKKERCITEAIAAASLTITSDTDYIRKTALKLFETMFEQNQGFKQAEELLKTHDLPELRTLIEQKNHL